MPRDVDFAELASRGERFSPLDDRIHAYCRFEFLVLFLF